MTSDDTETGTTVEFFFDPACPWTWLTSRWLVEVASDRALDIEWRNLSLAVLNAGNEIPEAHRSKIEVSALCHRMIASLRADRRADLIGDLYTEIGRRVHHDGDDLTVDLLREAAQASGTADWLPALDDASWDEIVESSTREALDLAGPDVGSPVIALPEEGLAFFGPIVSPPPTGQDAQALFDHVCGLAHLPGVYEVKRGRQGPPQMGPRP